MEAADVKRLALVLAVQAEIEGMKALNEHRSRCGDAVAYSEQAFLIKADELRNLAYKHDDTL